MKKIQVLKPVYRVDECLSEIRECLDSGWTGMGFKTIELEDQWKAYTGLSYAHFLNSATSGLHLAIKVLKEKYNWKNTDEIITTPFTFISTNHAIAYENLTLCFADIDDSLNLSPESVKKKINNNTKAIIFVGIGGNTKNLDEIVKIAKDNNLKIILDAAHMAGSRIDSQHVGFDVDVSVFSFQAVKNLPTADGGMVCFSNEKDDKKARELSWLGINKDTFSRSNLGSYKWNYTVNQVGYKYHGNSIMAALGIVGLKYLDEDNQIRRELASRYIKNLKGKVRYIAHESNQTSRHLFQIVVEDRDIVIESLTNNNIYPGVHYRQNNEYKPFQTEEIFIKSKYYSDRVLSLPLHLELSLEDVDRICNVLLSDIVSND
jgi:dTDP-4-amino-4,6-dideoxygalactose transaminase